MDHTGASGNSIEGSQVLGDTHLGDTHLGDTRRSARAWEHVFGERNVSPKAIAGLVWIGTLWGGGLGDALTGIALAMDHMLERLAEQGTVGEMELAHGATRWEAARDVLRDATRRGLIPIVNTMMVVGIVSLPGMMTGQILAGADPLLAVKYQIVVMFMIAAATSLACILMVLLVYGRLFNAKHQLLANEIIRKKGTLQ